MQGSISGEFPRSFRMGSAKANITHFPRLYRKAACARTAGGALFDFIPAYFCWTYARESETHFEFYAY